jgi:hypothetical protein
MEIKEYINLNSLYDIYKLINDIRYSKSRFINHDAKQHYDYKNEIKQIINEYNNEIRQIKKNYYIHYNIYNSLLQNLSDRIQTSKLFDNQEKDYIELQIIKLYIKY